MLPVRVKRTLLVFSLCMFAVAGRAGEKVSFGEGDLGASMVAAFTRAVGALPLDPKDGDQVRVWFDSVMTRHATGFIVTRKGVWRCSLRYENDNGEYIVVNRGTCRGPHRYTERIAKPMALLAQAAKLDGKSFACEVFDGWEAQIEGIHEGKRFGFHAANTQECKTEPIPWVDAFLDTVAGAWSKKDD
jgi:hypothetical protein